MADKSPYAGPIAAAKNVALVKAALDKKLDKSGGTIAGTLEVTNSLIAHSSIEAENYIKSDLLLMAPTLALNDEAKDATISIGVAGDNAAKVTSLGSDGKSRYSRLAVGTPTDDNDAATKQYVDEKAVTVDAALDASSKNPVQNKAIKAAIDVKADKTALDSKLDKTGGTITGNLDVSLSFGAGGSISAGVTDTDTGIHFGKATSDAGRISHGGADSTGKPPLARLKVASPTEDDDAATKQYVDDRAVRYDAEQTLTSNQKFRACQNIGAVQQKGAVYVAGLETPTDAQTDYAANVAYVKAKIAEVAASGGVDVDNALSATSTNPVQNKAVTAALALKAGTAVATQSANGLMSKADKAKLDGIAAGANKTTVDAALDASSTNPVQNKAVKAALDGKLSTSGGTLTGNLTGRYITGTWLQTTAASDLGKTPGKIAVLDESGLVYYRTPAELLADIGAATVSAMLDKAYPVGSIYMSVNSTNPQTLFGGTWVQIKDKFLLAAGTTYKAGSTGGEAAHALSLEEMPNHGHTIYAPNAGGSEEGAALGFPTVGSSKTWWYEASKTGRRGGGSAAKEGEAQAHNNLPPYITVYMWKRTA